ncbi:serine hydrolase [Nocardia sp. NBC_01327]|uniref:serine hydrolase n=1 Tax=Nocardia sp. NBC_01327 TaxID=2903593 RepID=UPI002E126E27|nr:class A beta-lactamase-related serine hydrolase [Nocardia sp. NBC_01327]
MAAAERIRETFAAIPVRGWLHAVDIDSGREIAVDAGDQVVIASIFKILLALEFCRQCAAGQLDPTERVLVRAEDRLGGWGTAGCQDDIELSLRDLAFFAMSVSDNTAADLLLRRIGADTPALLAAELGLDRTRVIGGPRELLESMLADVGAADGGEFARIYPALTREQVATMRVFRPDHTTSSTPREITDLLARIWRDEAGVAAACAATRDLLRRQVFWTRLAAGFPDEVQVASKTGTLPGLHMEAGVVEYPDGGRYAVAVFARTEELGSRRIDVDLAMSRAARAAVDQLRTPAEVL